MPMSPSLQSMTMYLCFKIRIHKLLLHLQLAETCLKVLFSEIRPIAGIARLEFLELTKNINITFDPFIIIMHYLLKCSFFLDTAHAVNTYN